MSLSEQKEGPPRYPYLVTPTKSFQNPVDELQSPVNDVPLLQDVDMDEPSLYTVRDASSLIILT